MGMLNEVKSKNKIKAAQNWLKLAENAKTPEKQVEYYTKALDANPYNAEAWFRKGRVLETMGSFEEAQRCFDLATEIDPDYQGLIGKKQYSAEPAADYPESSVFPENQNEDDAFMESELEEELTGEAVEGFMEEPGESFEGETHEQAGKERMAEETGWSGSGYKPPVGEESIFSNLGRRENEEAVRDTEMISSHSTSGDMQLVQETEIMPREENAYGNTLQADAGPMAKAEAAVTGIVQSGSEGTGFWKEEAADSGKEAQPRFANAGERSLKTGLDEKKKRPVKQPAKGPEGTRPQGQSRETQTVASVTKEDMQIMDIRIPMSETLKFWAVGIVAVIIALKVATYI
ncbi:tetratricopeptide repeat protein [Methanolobus chelungpuianus]|uniref:Tetratricopeptide repeat protein n=1 Tax=Methanolobus chelungpuianus TaxID=502115 RepID=A0AAE3KXD5_9EURY|nr:tetratricopeptide repeat protein [Methanolobus chelungpuianus]MCQ6962886.1 hypothetical protein [Methanolobus chelungpuianus]